MVGWHHRLNGHEFEPTLGASEGQTGLACWCPWGCKESDMTQQLNNRLPAPKLTEIGNGIYRKQLSLSQAKKKKRTMLQSETKGRNQKITLCSPRS